MSNKITDQFKIGDRVRWVRVTYVYLDGQRGVKAERYQGTIEKIEGSIAAIDSPQFQGLVMVSLFELEVISDEKAK